MSTPARATDIVFTRHGARRGLAWLAEAYAMFRSAKLAWVVLITFYGLVMFVIAGIPFIGPVLMWVLKPLFAVGMLAAAWTQERGGRPALPQLFQGFKANVFALIMLGAVLVSGIAAAFYVTSLIDGGALTELTQTQARAATADAQDAKAVEGTVEALITSGRLQRSALILMLLSLPTFLALFFAPALVVFQDTGPLAALGASLRAALANWRPLIVYALAIVALGPLLVLTIVQIGVTLFPSRMTIEVMWIALLVYGLIFAATLQISDYVCYRDIFHAGETLAPLGRPSPGA
jgi:hypothetical protein